MSALASNDGRDVAGPLALSSTRSARRPPALTSPELACTPDLTAQAASATMSPDPTSRRIAWPAAPRRGRDRARGVEREDRRRDVRRWPPRQDAAEVDHAVAGAQEVRVAASRPNRACHSMRMRRAGAGRRSTMSALAAVQPEQLGREAGGDGPLELKVCSARCAVQMPPPPSRASATTPGRRYAADRPSWGVDAHGSRYGRILPPPSAQSAISLALRSDPAQIAQRCCSQRGPRNRAAGALRRRWLTGLVAAMPVKGARDDPRATYDQS